MGYTFLDRIKILFNLIISSPFFLSVVVIFLLTTFVLVLYNRIRNKKLKYVIAFGYLLIAILILIKYGKSIISLSDNLVDQVFSFLYFPNIISYFCMIIITILILITTFVNKNTKFFTKALNIVSFVVILILFVLTLDVIIRYDIDIYTKTEVFRNDTLVVLIQASTFIFALWVFLLFINYIVNIINNRLDKNKFHEIEEKVDDKVQVFEIPDENIDDFEKMTDEEFSKLVKENKNNLYQEIFKTK